MDALKRMARTSWLRAAAAGLFALMIGLAPLHTIAADEAPAATIELSGGSVAVGIGYSWAKGSVTYQGVKHALKVNGISIIDVGISNYTASGGVYNLKKLSDIEGTYTAVEAGATVAGGVSATAMQNDKGVVIRMTATRSGLQFTLAPNGVTISLEKKK
ncbi:MAG: hypothetical protein ACYC1L_09230 [Alphaproteobacteria bacterium]